MKPPSPIVAVILVASVIAAAFALSTPWRAGAPHTHTPQADAPPEPAATPATLAVDAGPGTRAGAAAIEEWHEPWHEPAATPFVVTPDTARIALLPFDVFGAEAAVRARQDARAGLPTLWDPAATDPVAEAMLLELLATMEAFTAGHGEAYESWMQQISGVVGPEDAAFLHETLFAGHDWDTLRSLLEQRSSFSGIDYRDLIMGLGLMTGDISLPEITALIDAGVPLPEMSGYLFASKGRVEDMSALVQRGQISDLHRRDPLFGDTVAGTLIDHLGSAKDITGAAAVAKLQAVLDLGVEPSQDHGQQDLLTRIMISTTPANAEVMVTLARHLLSSGTVVTAQHRAIITRSAPSPLRDLYEYVLNNP